MILLAGMLGAAIPVSALARLSSSDEERLQILSDPDALEEEAGEGQIAGAVRVLSIAGGPVRRAAVHETSPVEHGVPGCAGQPPGLRGEPSVLSGGAAGNAAGSDLCPRGPVGQGAALAAGDADHASPVSQREGAEPQVAATRRDPLQRALEGAPAAAAAAPDAGGCVEQGISQPVRDMEPTAFVRSRRVGPRRPNGAGAPALLPHGPAGRR